MILTYGRYRINAHLRETGLRGVILGGRGAGKTRAGAEWVRGLVEGPQPHLPGICRRVALIGDTVDQVREVYDFW